MTRITQHHSCHTKRWPHHRLSPPTFSDPEPHFVPSHFVVVTSFLIVIESSLPKSSIPCSLFKFILFSSRFLVWWFVCRSVCWSISFVLFTITINSSQAIFKSLCHWKKNEGEQAKELGADTEWVSECTQALPLVADVKVANTPPCSSVLEKVWTQEPVFGFCQAGLSALIALLSPFPRIFVLWETMMQSICYFSR